MAREKNSQSGQIPFFVAVIITLLCLGVVLGYALVLERWMGSQRGSAELAPSEAHAREQEGTEEPEVVSESDQLSPRQAESVVEIAEMLDKQRQPPPAQPPAEVRSQCASHLDPAVLERLLSTARDRAGPRGSVRFQWSVAGGGQ